MDMSQRRASPPRPSMILGSIADCQQIFGEMLPSISAVLLSSNPSACDFEPLVWRLRCMRETLVSLHAVGTFVVQVYETSVDVCAAAQNLAELLKCVSRLTAELYVQQDDGSNLEVHERYPEMLAVRLILFGSGLLGARRGTSQMVALLHETAAVCTLQTPCVQYALKLISCSACGDYVTFFRTVSSAPTTLLRVMGHAAGLQVRTKALRCITFAYQAIPISALKEHLALGAYSLSPAAIPAKSDHDSKPVSKSKEAGSNISIPSFKDNVFTDLDSKVSEGKEISILLLLLKDLAENGCKGANVALLNYNVHTKDLKFK